MAVIRHFVDADKDQGRQYDYGVDLDTKKLVRLQIRGIPDWHEQRIRREYNGDVLKTRLSKGNQFIDIELEKSRLIAQARACFALIDTTNFEVFVGDEDAAAGYTKVLGQPTEAGKPLLLDGRWNDAVKSFVLGANADIVSWIIEKVDGLHALTEERQKELLGNS